MRHATLMGILAVLAFLSARAWTLPTGDWQKWESEHFIVYSSQDSRSTSSLIQRLELFRDFLVEVYGSAKIDDLPKPKAFLFRGASQFAPYAWGDPNTRIAYMLRCPDDNYIAASWTHGISTNATLYHELTHFYLGNTFGRIPLWVNEGLAVYYSTFVANQEVARVGRPSEGQLRILRHWDLQDLRDVIQVHESTSEYNEEKQSQLWYAQSWLLTHYVMHELTDGRTRLLAFLEQSNLTNPGNVESVFRLSLDAVSAELQEYAQREELPHDVTPIAHLRRERVFNEVPFDNAELYAALGHLLLRLQGNHTDMAREHFEAALAMQKEQPLPLIGLARVHLLENQPKQADDCCERGLGEVADANAYLTCGEVDYAMAFIEQNAGQSVMPRFRSARSRLRRAIELAPNLTRAYTYFGYCHLTTHQDALAAISILEPALKQTQNYRLLPVLALLYKKAGEIERGRELLTESLSQVTDAELRQKILAALEGL